MKKAEILNKWNKIFREARGNELGCDYSEKIAHTFEDHIVSLDNVDFGQQKFLSGDDIFQVKDQEGNSLLHQATKMKNVPLICYLITQGVDPNLRNNQGKTYLELDEMQELIGSLTSRAASTVNHDIARAPTLEPQIKSVIHCSDREFEVVLNAFLKKIRNDRKNTHILENINKEITEDGATLLHLAALNGQSFLVKELIERGADCLKTTANGITPLMSACMSNSNTVVQEIMKQDGYVNDTAADGNTALHAAVIAGKYGAVKLLLKNPDIDISIQNNIGETAADLCEDPQIKALIQAKEVHPIAMQVEEPQFELQSRKRSHSDSLSTEVERISPTTTRENISNDYKRDISSNYE